MIGTVLNNTYRLERALTEGGMGQVFIASHLRIKGRKYAIKQLRPELAAAPNFQTRFQVEAEVMMELEHPHIVRIEDFLVQDNCYYLVMEFIEGNTLDGHLTAHGAMPTEEVHRMAIELLSGLAYCHDKGVIHRDLKPSNLLLTVDGTLKLTDFGIALQENTDKRLTRTGTILGTPDYMSPEQIMSYALDGRSDLYSAGIILYEMAAGLPPFLRSDETGGSYQILFAHVHRPPPDLDQATIPDYLRRAIAKSLEKDPSDRFSSAQEMMTFLETSRAEAGLPPVSHGLHPVQMAAALSSGSLDAVPAVPHHAPSQDALDASPAPQPSRPVVREPLLKETAPTPSNDETSALVEAHKEASTKAKSKLWTIVLLMAFMTGVGMMSAWWVVEPESFAKMQRWVEKTTGLKAPLPSYKRPVAGKRLVVLTPRRTRANPLRDTAHRKVIGRRPDVRTKGVPQALALGTKQADRKRAIPRRAPGIDVPWPMPAPRLGNVQRRPPPRRIDALGLPLLPRDVAPLLRRKVSPHARHVIRRPIGQPKNARRHPVVPRRAPAVRQRDVPRRLPPVVRALPRSPNVVRPNVARRVEPRVVRPVPRKRGGIDLPTWGFKPLPRGRLVPERRIVPRARPRTSPRPTARRMPPVRRERLDPLDRDPGKDPLLAPHPRKRVPSARPRVAPRRPLPIRRAPSSRRPLIRQLPLQRQPRPRPPARRHLIVPPRPILRAKPSEQWPMPVSAQCNTLLSVCTRSCLGQRNIITPSFRRHCFAACWQRRIIRYRGKQICPPDPPPEARPQRAPTPRRKFSL